MSEEVYWDEVTNTVRSAFYKAKRKEIYWRTPFWTLSDYLPEHLLSDEVFMDALERGFCDWWDNGSDGCKSIYPWECIVERTQIWLEDE